MMRIVLSAALLLAACSTTEKAFDDEPANGIGTSPSEPVPELGPALVETGEQCWVRPCAVFVLHSDETEIDTHRMPDVVEFANPGGLSCVDALRISSVMYPGRSLVRLWP